MDQEHGTHAIKRRRQITLNHYITGRQSCASAGSAGGRSQGQSISSWNQGMARRLGAFLDNFREDFRVMVTLTYPNTFPNSGSECKRHLKAFTERARRSGYLEHASFVWFLEFQERGAPHFHLLCTEFIGMHWVARSWSEVTGGNIQACSRTERLLNPNSAGAYARKYAAKSEQKVVPKGFEKVGRMWGCCGNKFSAAGIQRVPVEAAALESLLPREVVQKLIFNHRTVRMTETDSGFVIWGTETEIKNIWLQLKQRGRPRRNAFDRAKRNEMFEETLRQEMSREFCATQGRPE